MLFKRDYGISCTIEFPLYDTTGVSLAIGATFAAGDLKIIKDGGAAANTTNLPTDEGNGQYSLVLTATEMQAVHISLSLDDQTATELWAGTGFQVETRITVGEYGGGVWFDEASGATGTTVGVHGSPLRPVNTFADAVTLATSTGLRRVFVAGVSGPSFNISSAISGLEVVGLKASPTAVFTTAPVISAKFINCAITGTLGTGSVIYTVGGFANDLGVNVASMVCENTGIYGVIGMRASINSQFFNCYGLSASPPSLDFTPTASSADLLGYVGAATIINMGATNSARFDGTGEITIAASCTGGTLSLRGQFKVTDNSSGAVTIDNSATGVNLTQINGSATTLSTLAKVLDGKIVSTVTGSVTANSFLASGISSDYAIDSLVNAIVFLTNGTAKGVRVVITAYGGPGNKTVTVDPFPVVGGTPLVPTAGDEFIILV